MKIFSRKLLAMQNRFRMAAKRHCECTFTDCKIVDGKLYLIGQEGRERRWEVCVDADEFSDRYALAQRDLKVPSSN